MHSGAHLLAQIQGRDPPGGKRSVFELEGVKEKKKKKTQKERKRSSSNSSSGSSASSFRLAALPKRVEKLRRLRQRRSGQLVALTLRRHGT